MEEKKYPSIDQPWLKHTKKYQSKTPSCQMSAYSFIKAANSKHLDEPSLIYDLMPSCKSTTITYRELLQKIDDCAKAYSALEISVGDVVTICLPSTIEGIVSFYALNKLGAVANFIHPIASRDEISFYLEEAESKVFVCMATTLEKIKKTTHLPLKTVVIVSLTDEFDAIELTRFMSDPSVPDSVKSILNHPIDSCQDGFEVIPWKEFMRNGTSVRKGYVNATADSSIAVLTHTSGTTGRSKAVATSSIALNKSVDAVMQETQLFQRGDTELLVVPPYPLYSLNNAIHLSISAGICLIVAPMLDISRMSAYFMKYSIQHMKCIPLHIDAILHDAGFDDINLSKFKFLISGGGRLTDRKVQLINDFLQRHHCPYGIANGYGMSEAGGCVTCMFENTTEKSTVGRPLIGSIAKIVDLNSGEELSYDEEGEVLLTGPSIMSCYYHNPEDTCAVLTKDAAGTVWLKTGDLGAITTCGNLRIVGRIKRMTLVFDPITNTVSKVSHDYVEEVICQIPNVKSCVVVAVENAETHNALRAYIVLNDNTFAETVRRIDQFCKRRFRKYISPIEYVIVEQVPLTKAGKTNYRLVEHFELGLGEYGSLKVLKRIAINER